MVKSKVTQREETSVAKSSRKGLEKATCRRKGYGNSEACATAVTLNQPWTGSERSEDERVCSVGFSLTIQRSRVSEEHCLTMFSLYLLLLSVACALLCWYKKIFPVLTVVIIIIIIIITKIAKIFINIWPIYIPQS